jgi:hypothetical protein
LGKSEFFSHYGTSLFNQTQKHLGASSLYSFRFLPHHLRLRWRSYRHHQPPPPRSTPLTFFLVAVCKPALLASATALVFDRRRLLIGRIASSSSSSPPSFVSFLALLSLLGADKDEIDGGGDVRGGAACLATPVLAASLLPAAVGVPRAGLPPLGFGVSA